MKFSKKSLILITFFLIGLIYILSPGPDSIDDFEAIPDSLKSDEPGDTYQVPEVAAYFSDFNRESITNFYRDDFREKFIFGWIFPPISLNYPPIAAYQYVRDLLQQSTFLEEYIYPLRGSIFVNGYEPHVEKEIKKFTHDKSGGPMQIKGQYFKSKTTIRFYPVSAHLALLTYLGIWVALILLFRLFEKVVGEEI